MLECEWTDGHYYPGKITQVFPDNFYKFSFSDGSGDVQERIHGSKIQERRSHEDSSVELRSEEDCSEEDSSDDDEEESSSYEEKEEEGEVEGEMPEEQASIHDQVETKNYYEKALKEFLVSLMKNYEYFINGKTTSDTESFHNVCNQYYPKSLSISFPQYVMRKTFAAFDWMEMRSTRKLRKSSEKSPKKPRQAWQLRILEKFNIRIEENNRNIIQEIVGEAVV